MLRLLLILISLAGQRAILTELSDFLAIPNLAPDAPNIARNAAAIRAMFEKRGVTTRLLTFHTSTKQLSHPRKAPNQRRLSMPQTFIDPAAMAPGRRTRRLDSSA